jgi:hypothetical protein
LLIRYFNTLINANVDDRTDGVRALIIIIYD